MYLEKLHPHPRDAQIVFDEGPHVYTILCDPEGKYMSVTTWNHSHFSEFDADVIIDKMMSNPSRWKQSKYYGKTKQQIKDEWAASALEASTLGTQMHKAIECYYNRVPIEPEVMKTREYCHFLSFLKDFPELKPYRTEWMIFDTELKFAGSVDMLFENPDGTLEIYDWKRSKEIKMENPWQDAITPCISHLPDCNYYHYCLQLNTYREILERNYGVTIRGMYLVILHPNQETYLRIQVEDLREEIRDLFKYRLSMLYNICKEDECDNNDDDNNCENENMWMGE